MAPQSSIKMEKVELSLILGTVFFPNGDELEAIFLNGKMERYCMEWYKEWYIICPN